MNFKTGQRWYSKAETELGLGLILKIEDRFVQVFYPHAQETRTYNAKSSPLKRYIANIGDEIELTNGKKITIEQINEENDLLVYTSKDQSYPEELLSSQINLNNPEDKLFSGIIDPKRHFDFRYETILLQRKIEELKYRGYYSSKVGLIPHQMSILATIDKHKIKKFILADEVGLGKTIESLNVMKHYHELGLIKSILILTPHSLQYQWFIEIYRKFNMVFKTLGLTDMMELDGLNDNDQLIISTPKHLNDNIDDQNFIRERDFDLVIVDESHQLNLEKYEYLINKVNRSQYTMFLTATPEAMGTHAFEAQLKLLGSDKQHFFRNRREVLEKQYSLFPKKNLIELPINEKISNDTQALKAKVAAILEQLDDEKTLIITHSKESARKIKRTIEEIKNTRIALFHSEMELMERDRQVAYFQDPEGANLLICTEIGSEGRNFEFAKKLVLMDISSNPNHLIQRIGRLDRIGQKNNFDIIIPYIMNSFEENLMYFYKEIDIFQTFPKGISLYYERIKEGLQKALTENDKDGLRILAKNYSLFRDDQISDTNTIDQFSFNKTYHEEVLNEHQALLNKIDLKEYLNKVCDILNIEFEDLSEDVFMIRATQNMLVTFPGMSFDGKMYTLNRELALIRDDIALMSIEDPILKNIIEFVIQTEFGNITVLKGETKGLELYYALSVKNTTSNYQALLALTPLRLFIDFNGLDMTKNKPKAMIDQYEQELSEEEKIQLSNSIPRETFIELIQKSKTLIAPRVNQYITKAIESSPDEIDKDDFKNSIQLSLISLRLII